MASKTALLCLLGFLMVVASPAIAESGLYYQLALMWPGAYCEQTNAGCCRPSTGVSPARDFYISNLTVHNTTTPQCSDAPFDPNKIMGLQGLNQYWSSIRCPSNNGKGSWKNVWNTAGSCSGLEEKDYFKTALEFRSRLNPLVRLKDAGIQPDFGLYSVKVIKRAFKEAIKVEPVIQCSNGPFDKLMLFQLYFCALGNGTFINCPDDAHTFTCSKEILFHPFQKWMLKQQQLNLNGDDVVEYAAL